MTTPLRLLIIEDNANDVLLMVNLLERDGFTLTSRQVDTLPAVRAALSEPWDMVICDYHLTGCTGREVLHVLRSLQPDLPVIVVSGSLNEDAAVTLLKAGAKNCLSKDRLLRLGPMVRHELADAEQLRQRQRVEEALRHSENRLHLLSSVVELGPYVVIIQDPQRLTIYVNPQFTALTGFAAPEVLGQRLTCLLAPDNAPELFTDLTATTAAGQPWEGEMRVQCKDGRTTWARVSVAPILDATQNITHFVIFSVDINDTVSSRDETRIHHQQLAQADKMMALGTLVAGVAHEINNPANFISLNVPLLQDIWTSAQPVLDQHASENSGFQLGGLPYAEMRKSVPRIFSGISEGVARIRGIVAELKDFARHGPSEPDQEVDLNAVIKAALSLMAGSLRKTSAQFATHLAEDLPHLKGNFRRLEQVVVNLIQNANEALTADGQKITMTTRFDPQAGRVLLEVADQGRGIGADLLSRVTEPFFTTRAEAGGTGLGLSIVATIVKEHHGRLAFASTPGQGTTVTVSLPRI